MDNDTTTAHNWHLHGHESAVRFLQKSLRHGRARHAYLFTGPQNIGKTTLAHAFAAALQCEQEEVALRPCGQCRSCKRLHSGNHPDILYARHDDKTGTLKIDALREVMQQIALKPFASRYRIAILEHFDAAQERAQDALLKTLEEPPPRAVLLLLAQTAAGLMATITSRCQVLPLRPLPLATVEAALLARGADPTPAAILARLSGGRMGWALLALDDAEILQQRDQALTLLEEALTGGRLVRFRLAENLGKLEKSAVRAVLELWQTGWRDLLLLAHGQPVELCNIDRADVLQRLAQQFPPAQLLRGLKATRHLLNDTLLTNASMRLALEVMLLEYPGLARR
ncbi:MAG: DNA polymerase III subunit delta' [Anaerolineae bacterium]|nr:DNA polymerase III subunit delta' [Anaerolineae bacterium]